MPKRRPPFLVSLALSASVAGCADLRPWPGSDKLAPASPPTWQSSSVRGEVRSGWLASFQDPKLVALVDEALATGPDLEAAQARLAAAIAIARQAGANRSPHIGGGATASRQIPFESSEPGGEDAFNSSMRGFEHATLGASLDLSWEIDLWGRLRAAHHAARARAAASAVDLEGTRRSLAGQIAKAWFFAIAAKLQKNLADEFVENFLRTESLVRRRFDAGAVTQQDLSSAVADLASARQNAEQAGTVAREALRSLESLVGRYPAAQLRVPESLPEVPGPVPAGLPAEIMERRPDLVMAELEVASAFELGKEARAARLPRLALTGSLGTSSNALSTLADPTTTAVDVAGNLFAPLLDAGLRKAQVEEADARQREAMAAYRRAALNAFQEVENLLYREQSLRRQVDYLETAAGGYAEARSIAQRRYEGGETDITSVLIVQRFELESRTALIETRADRLSQRVNLHLALGGDFEPAGPPPPP